MYVITQSCCSDAACVAVCPVNCIHPTPEERGFGSSDILHIDPQACIDCGACADACPVNAIYPADRLGARDRVFIEVNADYYRTNPDVSSGWTDVVYPHLPKLPAGLRIAVVGTGPSGGYTLRTLLDRTSAQITVIDKLPTPGGLVRAGVAPDHPSTKDVMKTFDLLYRDPRVRMATNVEIGSDAGAGQISPAELAAHFDAVFYCVGAGEARRLGIPGDRLPGSTSATDLVAWYNAVPGAPHPPLRAGGSSRAVIVGTGNVALDVARILVTPPELLAATDIADRALAVLAQQNVHEVVLLGRRGPETAAYTPAEFRALQSIPGVDVLVHNGPLEQLELAQPVPSGRRRIIFLFNSTSTEIQGDTAVTSMAVRTAGTDHVIATDLVVSAIGYRAVPIDGLCFDDERGVLANSDGRLVDADGTTLPGQYVSGWARRGASGGIGANKLDAVQMVERFLADAHAGGLARASTGPDEFGALLRARVRAVVGYRGVAAIDRAERARGARNGRPRVKFTEVPEMLKAAGRRR